MNLYLNKDLSRKKWLKQPPYIVNCFEIGRDADGKETRRVWESNPIRIKDFDQHIESHLGFVPEEFNLFAPKCGWLDADVFVAPGFHMVDDNGDVLRFQTPLPLGTRFPVLPAIDREGHIYSSMQALLQKSVVGLRKRLVMESSQFQTNDWFNLLRMFIADAVSLIDMTLHNLYTKAEFDPLPGWSFDPKILGSRQNRRLKDKIKWVYKITGKQLNDIGEEVQSFDRLRQVRNHLQHFDPPCFGFTLEDVVVWLNDAIRVGCLAWKIRKRLGSPITIDLIELIIAPEVGFFPRNPEKRRKPQPDNVGYTSTCWPNQVQDDNLINDMP